MVPEERSERERISLSLYEHKSHTIMFTNIFGLKHNLFYLWQHTDISVSREGRQRGQEQTGSASGMERRSADAVKGRGGAGRGRERRSRPTPWRGEEWSGDGVERRGGIMETMVVWRE